MDAFWQTGIESFDKKCSKLERKFAEPFMALEAERMMSKDEILAAYMSMNYMGTVGNIFYKWRQKYGGMEVSETRRLRELEKENARLKRLLAERCIEIDAMKEVIAKKW